MTSSAWFGSMTVNRGRMEKKYGAFWPNANEKTRAPTSGIEVHFCHRERTWLMPPCYSWVGNCAPDTCQINR